MTELSLINKLREYLSRVQGREVDLKTLRGELRIDPDSSAWTSINKLMAIDLTNEKIVKPSGRRDGIYKVITQVQPVKVFGRERKPPVNIIFPRDFDSQIEMAFADDIIMREGDLVLISGRSNYGKTCLCMNFCGENIESRPVLMGNEYTTIDHEASPRFLSRLDNMDWVNWVNGSGEEKFTLLPVYSDYAEHIIKDRINIIDWINIETGEFYLISRVMEDIKRALGSGIGIIALQKAEGAASGRGGQFTKDFADVEILLDEYNQDEVLLTLGKVKESRRRVGGRNFAFSISKGVKIINFRELEKCKSCSGKGYRGANMCDTCNGTGYKDKAVEF